MRFFDRVDAGRRLGARLEELALRDVVVLGLVRGGVPVGYEVARILDAPLDVAAVGAWYHDFSEVTDDAVVALLRHADADRGNGGSTILDEDVEIDAQRITLLGRLCVPADARAIVVFAHGSGSSRFSSRNQYVARVLNQAGLGTLLFDLLTNDEELNRAHVFDVELLAGRLEGATAWLCQQPEAARSALGYFGASTGAAAALWAAAGNERVRAVVSRGGRPDLAMARLAAVRAPTLFVVGSDDPVVLDLNREAQAAMRCETRLEVVPGASHLFEEPGTLDVAANLACAWFLEHLAHKP